MCQSVMFFPSRSSVTLFPRNCCGQTRCRKINTARNMTRKVLACEMQRMTTETLEDVGIGTLANAPAHATRPSSTSSCLSRLKLIFDRL